jgi:hypothetical protein
MLTACGASAPHQLGQFRDLGPRVAATPGERVPIHATVQLTKPANIAVFLVMPGRGSTLLFPMDSMQNGYMEAGSHLIETAYAKNVLSDSARLIRRPGDPQPPPGTRPTGGIGAGRGGRIGRDSLPTFGFNQRGYLMIYASQEPLPYATLSTRVASISVPIADNDALNTVAKVDPRDDAPPDPGPRTPPISRLSDSRSFLEARFEFGPPWRRPQDSSRRRPRPARTELPASVSVSVPRRV